MFGRVYILDPEDIKYVMQDHWKNFVLTQERAVKLGDLMGQGIFGVNGKEWQLQHNAARHIFSQVDLNNFVSEVHFLVYVWCFLGVVSLSCSLSPSLSLFGLPLCLCLSLSPSLSIWALKFFPNIRPVALSDRHAQYGSGVKAFEGRH